MPGAVRATAHSVHVTTGTLHRRNFCKGLFVVMTRATVSMPVTTTVVTETTQEASGARFWEDSV